jgi:hypothetical protein
LCGHGVEFSGIGDAVFSAEDGTKKVLKGLFLSEHIAFETREVHDKLFESGQHSAQIENLVVWRIRDRCRKGPSYEAMRRERPRFVIVNTNGGEPFAAEVR